MNFNTLWDFTGLLQMDRSSRIANQQPVPTIYEASFGLQAAQLQLEKSPATLYLNVNVK